MIGLLGFACLAGAQLGRIKWPAEGLAVLTFLAANLLVFRTFRDRYLLTWIVGWLAYSVYRLPVTFSATTSDLVPHLAFVVAAFFFSAAVLIYADAPRLILPSASLATVALGTIAVRCIWMPNSAVLIWAVGIIFRLFLLTAVLQLVRPIVQAVL